MTGPQFVPVGLDLSLTGTGVAWFPGPDRHSRWSGRISTERIATGPKGPTGGWAGDRFEGPEHRLHWLTHAVASHCYAAGHYWSARPFLVIEGRAYHGHDTEGMLDALRWAVRGYAWRTAWPFVSVAPSTVKKFATGNGRAKKADMIAVMSEATGRRLSEDEADAAALACLGAAALGLSHPLADTDAADRAPAAIAAVRGWPT